MRDGHEVRKVRQLRVLHALRAVLHGVGRHAAGLSQVSTHLIEHVVGEASVHPANGGDGHDGLTEGEVDPSQQQALGADKRSQDPVQGGIDERRLLGLLEQHATQRRSLQQQGQGGEPGVEVAHPHHLEALAHELGIADVMRFAPPVAQRDLVDWYRAADVTVVPSYNESFGLVAIESQAVGTPVVAASVGGLRTAVADGVSGALIDGHNPHDYADVLGRLISEPRRRETLAAGAVRHAAEFGWDATAKATLAVYEDAVVSRRLQRAAS